MVKYSTKALERNSTKETKVFPSKIKRFFKGFLIEKAKFFSKHLKSHSFKNIFLQTVCSRQLHNGKKG